VDPIGLHLHYTNFKKMLSELKYIPHSLYHEKVGEICASVGRSPRKLGNIGVRREGDKYAKGIRETIY
jgi:hypothetical protein